MILNVVISDNSIPINVPDAIITEAAEFFDKLDADMEKGWQVGREWVDKLNIEQRCQVVADKMLTALENENQQVSVMMAAYILNRVPGIKGVRTAINGEINETELLMDRSQF